MELDYSGIFSCFVDLMKAAIPVSCLFYFSDIMINFFLNLAFPKMSRRGD